jgi:polysaccharide deacetylase family protein (PEP-CTERM system associated)
MQKQILTVNVEDYFHVWALRGSDAVLRKHWDRLDPRLEASLDAVLELLERHDAKATFFVFGCIADRQPHIIESIVSRGHEIASRGYWPRSLAGLGPTEFVDDLGRAKEALEAAGSNRIVGYRSPAWLRRQHLWMLDELIEQGYQYDSSINPILFRFIRDSYRWQVHQHWHSARNAALWEVPISTMGMFGVRIAISGGNYIRQLPHSLLSRAVQRKTQKGPDPVIFYFMPWELDLGQPHIQGISLLNRIRHYRNLPKTRLVLEEYLTKYRFDGIADYFGLVHDPLPPHLRPVRTVAELPVEEPVGDEPILPVSLVVPMYNERQNITYLRRTLLGFRARLASRYRIHLVLVDDCSTDDTWDLLTANFSRVPDCSLVRHSENRGVAGALMTGITSAPTEIVCSIDCDCSYDPTTLARMIPLIDGAEMVTASPYHPEGSVRNVPGWRLVLSKVLSRLYSAILGDHIHTFTSCCRVYKKSAVVDLELHNGGFLGIAEMLIETKRRGGRIVEFPATLESRLLGESKMKIVRTIGGHLGLLRKLAMQRGRGAPRGGPLREKRGPAPAVRLRPLGGGRLEPPRVMRPRQGVGREAG